MKHDLDRLKTALNAAQAVAVKAELARLVPFADLTSQMPPNWLYTSGRPNRYNPPGIQCIYFSGSPEVARAEYDSMWHGTVAVRQPVTMFFAHVKLKRVLDLTDPAILKTFDLHSKDLSKNWRRAKLLTATQLLGQAVTESGKFSAIRYPSVALAGPLAVNFVIFQNCVHSPDSVTIIGGGQKPLARWPSP